MITNLSRWWNRTDREHHHPQARDLHPAGSHFVRYDVTVHGLTADQAEALYDIAAHRFKTATTTKRSGE